MARTWELGLFPEPLTASPYAAEREEQEVTEAADEGFWAGVHADARAACALTLNLDERPPLCAALPDSDGVLRARW
ncbi:hypothetical protein [Streptomyces xanthophaeus]